MQYFLALDLGKMYVNKDRYKKIDLSTISPILGQNHNFKYLCNFTMEFNNSQVLKEFLLKKGLINNYYINHNLVFTYKLTKDNTSVNYGLDIPYQNYKTYFNYATLPNIIKHNIVTKENYLNNIINYYMPSKYLPEGFYHLRKIQSNNLTDAEIFEAVRYFVRDMCYKNGNFSYREFYKLAMLIAKLDGVTHECKEEKNIKKESINDDSKFANLKARQEIREDDQMRLF